MLRSRHIGAVFVALLCVTSCRTQSDKHDAEQVLQHYFTALAHQKYDVALTDYDDRFFADMTRNDWRNALISVTTKIGNVEHYDITVDGLESKKTVGPGTYLKFKCKVRYTKHTSEETLYLFRPEGSVQFHIIGHQIDSNGLLAR